MNLAQRLLADGANLLAHESAQGELVAFDGVDVWVNVNRLPISTDPNGSKEASTEEGSVIEYPLNFTVPERGDVLTDSYGFTHRVKMAKHIGHAIRLECEVVR